MAIPTWAQKRAQAASSSRELRSGFEALIVKQLDLAGISYDYEREAVVYEVPAKRHKKTWDLWITTKSGKLVVVEVKGYWAPSNRIAELAAIAAHPEIDVRYCFMRSRTRISKRSKTTYADVCKKHGVLYADGAIPEAWFNE